MECIGSAMTSRPAAYRNGSSIGTPLNDAELLFNRLEDFLDRLANTGRFAGCLIAGCEGQGFDLRVSSSRYPQISRASKSCAKAARRRRVSAPLTKLLCRRTRGKTTAFFATLIRIGLNRPQRKGWRPCPP